MAWKTLDDLDLNGKTVLTRVDINVPYDNGEITDWTRIDRIYPTVQSILEKGGKPVLLAHFGRPKGKFVADMSLAPIAQAMDEKWSETVKFAPDCVGSDAQNAIDNLQAGEVLVLENTRFYPGEEKNDTEFAQQLAALGDVYVNDAFSAAHRAHASTEGIAQLLPNCAGRLMAQELGALEAALSTPKPPVVAIVGGAKISTKLELIGNLIPKVDYLVIGGGMANTFLAAQGAKVGKSLCEYDLLETAKDILEQSKSQSCEIVLPSDVVTAKEFKAGAAAEVHAADACPEDQMILDAGPETVTRIKAIFDECKTLVWNGPLGAFEIPPFDAATNAAARHAAALTDAGALLSVAGGGDTVAALNASDSASRFSYVSTAGGAFLEWLEGKTLPGVAALQNDK